MLLGNRSPILPDVPTIIEAGVPEVSARHWAAALKKPEVVEKLLTYGYAVESSTPARLLEINRDDLALWRRLVAQAGIALE